MDIAYTETKTLNIKHSYEPCGIFQRRIMRDGVFEAWTGNLRFAHFEDGVFKEYLDTEITADKFAAFAEQYKRERGGKHVTRLFLDSLNIKAPIPDDVETKFTNA